MEVKRKYGAAATIRFPLISASTSDFDDTPVTFAAGDIQLSKDDGAFANTTNTPVHEGNGFYSLLLSATEMEAAYHMVTVIDQTATKVWKDQAIIIQTFGNASAGLVFDLSKTAEDSVWDAALSGHNTAGTSGKYLRQIKEGVVSVEASVNDAGATTTVFITSLTETADSFYSDMSMMFIDGALKGQCKPILSYNGTTKTITLDEALTSAPANGVGFIILCVHVHPVSEIVSSVLSSIIEGSITLKQSLQLSNAGAAGKLSGAATTSIAIRDQADTKDRISATVDADGNRTAIVKVFD